MNFFEMLVLIHFISDWIFQTQKHASRKHKDLGVLLQHSLIYTIFFIPLLLWKVAFIPSIFLILLLLFVSHAFLDNRKFELWILKLKGIYVDSDFQSYYKDKNDNICMLDKGLIWVILITIDQILHISILAIIALLV